MNTPIKNRLEDWAQRTPDAIAIIDGDRQLTWRQWNSLADSLAQALVERGIGSQDVVAVRLHNRWEWAVLYSALAKIDCAMVGLNWRLTPPEINYILHSAEATAFVCDDTEPAALSGAFEGMALKLCASVVADSAGFTPFAELLRAPAKPRYSRTDPKLIIFTSGTTGFPKGVVTGQVNPKAAEDLKDYLEGTRTEQATAAPGEGEVVLVTMPMHHAAGPAIVRRAVSTGSTMVFMQRFDPEEVLRLIERYRVTTWNGVPTMYKRIAALPPEVLSRYDVSSIRTLTVGAAPVPWPLKVWIMDFFGECLREGYGSTETGMVTSLPPHMQRLKPGSSGKPFKGVRISIRDSEGNELPAGEVGEIWVRTPYTIASYLNAGELDSDTVDAEGFFRVGDVGYLDEDGYLFITDRSKDLIISGGVNIYPAEIETVLLRHPAVQDIAVIGIPNDEFGEEVKAFCELKPGHEVTERELLQFAADHLASYKRPRSIEFVSELPRNTMGKVLKRELRAPYWKNKERNV